jgi:hypothetical protein
MTGCQASSTAVKNEPQGDTFVLAGRMEFVNIETGCWVLVSDDGNRYEPSGDNADSLWKDGLRVTIRARQLTGVASICQTGRIVEVVEIIEIQEQ